MHTGDAAKCHKRPVVCVHFALFGQPSSLFEKTRRPVEQVVVLRDEPIEMRLLGNTPRRRYRRAAN